MMNHALLNELASQREAELAAAARTSYRNPLRGHAGFHEDRDLARVIARLRALASQT